MFSKIWQNLQKNSCARVSFLIKLQASGTGVFLCKIFKNNFFTEHLWAITYAHCKVSITTYAIGKFPLGTHYWQWPYDFSTTIFSFWFLQIVLFSIYAKEHYLLYLLHRKFAILLNFCNVRNGFLFCLCF